MTSYRVAIVGCGRMGQHYAEVYQALPDTDVVAIAEYDPERRRAVGERFGVGALFPDAAAMLREVVPDIAAVVLDVHTSIVEGSISAIPRRLMVASDDLARARAVLVAADALGTAGEGTRR